MQFVRISLIAAALLSTACSERNDGAATSAATAGAAGAAAVAHDARAAPTELDEALSLVGDRDRGAQSYAVCASCHFADGSGRADGTFPRLAGQHAAVLVKQMVDMRSGSRRNPVMHPYAQTLSGAQEIADLAAYLAAAPSPKENGQGDGVDLERGEALYSRDCAACHGADASGNGPALVPALAGQHYRYLLRQLRDIAGGHRHNARPEMQKIVAAYRDEDLRAVADYASRRPRRTRPSAAAPDPGDG